MIINVNANYNFSIVKSIGPSAKLLSGSNVNSCSNYTSCDQISDAFVNFFKNLLRPLFFIRLFVNTY